MFLCPIALVLNNACSRSDYRHVSVGNNSIKIATDEKPFLYILTLPQKAIGFVSSFDDYRAVKPFTFYLTVRKEVGMMFRKRVRV